MKPVKLHRLLQDRVVIATHNQGKLKEMKALLAPFGIEAVSAGELNLPEPVEDGFMFSQNAAIKAKAASLSSGLPALADDSGLCIDALDGAPGLFSANWAGNPRDFQKAMKLVKDELEKRNITLSSNPQGEKTKAHFISALVLYWPDGHEELFEGRVFGDIIWPPRGNAGFGYDPLFLPEGSKKTFGEISTEEKHSIQWKEGNITALSHRARAFIALSQSCLPKRKQGLL